MKTIKYHEPKSLLDVRAWKRKVSKEIETLGWAEFHKRSEIIGKDLRERIEKRRLEKLAAKR